jgi:hypothetical protein
VLSFCRRPLDEVRHIVDRGLLLVVGSPKDRSQGSGNTYPNTLLAGVVPIVSSVDAL